MIVYLTSIGVIFSIIIIKVIYDGDFDSGL
jgi:hypothetical protein